MEGDENLEKLPILVLENVMRFLPFKDIKNLRCLNSR